MAKFRDKLATQLELIKQSQVKKNQQKCSESNSAQLKGNAPSNRVEKVSNYSEGNVVIGNARGKDYSTSMALAQSFETAMALSLGTDKLTSQIITHTNTNTTAKEQGETLQLPEGPFSRQVMLLFI